MADKQIFREITTRWGETDSTIDAGEETVSFQRDLERAKGLFQAMIRPAAEGGLGLQFDSLQQNPLRNVVGVYRDRQANCVEFVAFYLLAADSAGIPAQAGTNTSGELWAEQSRLDFLSYYYMSRGVSANRVDDVRLAHRMNPNNYFILYNLAAFAFRAGESAASRGDVSTARQRYEEARRYVTASIANYPNYQPVREGLLRVSGML